MSNSIPQARVCVRCRLEKALAEFRPHRRGRSGYELTCKGCRAVPAPKVSTSPPGYHFCRKCQSEKPLSAFPRRTGGRIASPCRECKNAYEKDPPRKDVGDSLTCGRCGQAKPLSDFHRKSTSRTGHRSACKACEKAYRNLPHVREREALRGRELRPLRAEYMRRWFQENRDVVRASQERSAERNDPVKREAREKLHAAVKSGRVVKAATCERCGQEVPKERLQGHHADYSKPLEVEWLCSTCHGRERRKYGDSDA